jgi:peptide-methionine (S)-S-oxide reductase
VVRTRVGYAGGTTPAPTYRGLGDHSEVVEVDYDPAVTDFGSLLDVFWQSHDPRRPALSRQYRSAILYRSEDDRRAAEASKARIEARVGRVTTAIEPLTRFYRAEDYHQKYRLRGRPDLMSRLRTVFPEDRGLVDSTAAARLNGWLGGHGTAEDAEAALSAVEHLERSAR